MLFDAVNALGGGSCICFPGLQCRCPLREGQHVASLCETVKVDRRILGFLDFEGQSM